MGSTFGLESWAHEYE